MIKAKARTEEARPPEKLSNLPGFPSWSLQKGLAALEALLRRKQGVDAWTTEDVVVWLHDIGLWSEKAEREASHK